jgi:hypothetical protein
LDALAGINTTYSGWNEKVIWPVLILFAYSSFVGLPLGAGTLAVLKPCLSIFMSSLVLPCEDLDRSVPTWIMILSFAVLEGFLLMQVLACGIMANVSVTLYCMVSLKTYLWEAFISTR